MSDKTTISKLIPDSNNANKGTVRGSKMIEDSLQRDGFGRSVLVDKNGKLIAGNKTIEGVTNVFGVDAEVILVKTRGAQVVAVQREDLDLDDPDPNNPARRLAYVDNLAHEFSFEFNPDVIMADMEAGFDFEALDIKMEDWGELLDGWEPESADNAGVDTVPQIDRAEELQKKWQVKPGDIWECAGHLVICGDCRETETWQRLLSAAGVDKVNGVFTSPPYAEQRKAQYGGVPADEYVEWWDAVQSNVRDNLIDDGSFFVNIKPASVDYQRQLYVFDLVLAMSRKWGWWFVDEYCWKQSGIPGDPKKMGKFKNQFEPIYQFSTGNYKFLPDNVSFESDNAIIDNSYQSSFTRNFQGSGANPFGERKKGRGFVYPGNLIEARSSESNGHQAAFPVALPTFFIKAYSDPNDVWLDPFLGSGTTAIAAHNEGRRGLGVERLEKYCAVILERWQTHTGIEPKLFTD